MRRLIASITALTLAFVPVQASAQSSNAGGFADLSSTSSTPAPGADTGTPNHSTMDQNVNDLNSALEEAGADFRFNSLEGDPQNFKIELEYQDTKFTKDPETGDVMAVNSDGTTELFADNSVKAPIGPAYGTSVELISENTIAISAQQSGYAIQANPYNLFGCVQNVLASATLLGTILGVSAVAAQALAAAGAAVAMAAAALYCSTI